MHATKKNIKFVNAEQVKQIYQHQNTEEKLYKSNAAIGCYKTCKKKVRILLVNVT